MGVCTDEHIKRPLDWALKSVFHLFSFLSLDVNLSSQGYWLPCLPPPVLQPPWPETSRGTVGTAVGRPRPPPASPREVGSRRAHRRRPWAVWGDPQNKQLPAQAPPPAENISERGRNCRRVPSRRHQQGRPGGPRTAQWEWLPTLRLVSPPAEGSPRRGRFSQGRRGSLVHQLTEKGDRAAPPSDAPRREAHGQAGPPALLPRHKDVPVLAAPRCGPARGPFGAESIRQREFLPHHRLCMNSDAAEDRVLCCSSFRGRRENPAPRFTPGGVSSPGLCSFYLLSFVTRGFNQKL